ncbi:filamentous hemagglutinin N-terminal domain-containing protein [Anaerobiospirillum succiniciproducens]|uniref:two-partner secretion domain-containing protein n=1 Tax=Anaerobiospirillum succiniciproducens TaxID=13335 RepID=UPI0004805F4A|nr:filamentous hemagglutinin N-terminal domain-containing protein [Anaerobiospirillum succiniciproducens]
MSQLHQNPLQAWDTEAIGSMSESSSHHHRLSESSLLASKDQRIAVAAAYEADEQGTLKLYSDVAQGAHSCEAGAAIAMGASKAAGAADCAGGAGAATVIAAAAVAVAAESGDVAAVDSMLGKAVRVIQGADEHELMAAQLGSGSVSKLGVANDGAIGLSFHNEAAVVVNEDSAEAMGAQHTHSHAQCAHSMAADAVNARNVGAGSGDGAAHFKEQGRVAALAAASANSDANAAYNADTEANAADAADEADAEAKAADSAEAESNDANVYAEANVPDDAVADGAKGEGGTALICARGAKSAMLKERMRISKLSLAAMMFCGAAWGYSNAALAAGAMPDINKAYNASISQQANGLGTVMTVSTNKNNALLIWNSFNVGAGNAVHFKPTPGKVASFLNVVKGPGASHIDGHIVDDSHGSNLYLINPNGISVGRTGSIENFKSVYLGTSKPSQELMNRFKDGNGLPLPPEIMPQGRGMGKITLMRSIESNDIRINGGHIIIGAAHEVFDAAEDKTKIQLNSSIDRIDIGGNLDAKLKTNQGMTYRDLLEKNGLKAAKDSDINVNGSHKRGSFIDHSKQVGIYGADQLVNIKNDMSGNYWLVGDIELKDHAPIGKDTNEAFKGTLDGAFNSITYSGTIDDSGNYGLFAATDGATVKNLKLHEAQFTLDAAAKGKDVNVGAIAGTMHNTKLENVEVNKFEIKDGRRTVALGAQSNLGGVAGKLDGNTKLKNVMVSLEDKSASKLANDLKAGKIASAGVLAGSVAGNVAKEGVVVALKPKDGAASLDAVSKNDAKVNIATTYSDAAAEALANGMSQDELNSIFVSSGTQGKDDYALGIKGFLKPFYVADFNFTYDGKVHDYRDLVNNEGFDIDSLLTKTDVRDYAQKDAGYYDFAVVTRKENQELGHDFYFSYKYADETWDKGAGGSGAIHDRNQRVDSLGGTLTVNINKKQVQVDVADQVIAHDHKPNLSLGKDTITNLDDLLAHGLVTGDKLDDLGISLEIGVDGSIIGKSNSHNYEVAFKPGTLTVLPKPQPQPMPQPLPKPEPLPEVNPAPQVPAASDDRELPTIAKCSHCGNIANSIGGAMPTLVSGSRKIYVGQLDYAPAFMAALEDGAPKESFNEQVLAYHDNSDANKAMAYVNALAYSKSDDEEDDDDNSYIESYAHASKQELNGFEDDEIDSVEAIDPKFASNTMKNVSKLIEVEELPAA